MGAKVALACSDFFGRCGQPSVIWAESNHHGNCVQLLCALYRKPTAAAKLANQPSMELEASPDEGNTALVESDSDDTASGGLEYGEHGRASLSMEAGQYLKLCNALPPLSLSSYPLSLSLSF